MARLVSNYDIHINAEPTNVYEYISDLTRHGEWSENLSVRAMSEGPIAVGNEYRSTGRMMRKQFENNIRVVACDRPNRLALSVTDGKSEFLQEFNISSENGGTLLQRKFSTNMNPLMLVMFKAVIGPLVANPSMNKSLRNLKSNLQESGS